MAGALWGQMFVNSLMLGLTYCLIASGLTLIFGVMRIVNFAHGEIYVLGLFAVYSFSQVIGLPYFASLSLGILLVAILGLLIEKIFFRPLRGKELASFVLSLGLIFLIQGVTLTIFGPQDKAINSGISGVWHVAGVSMSKERIIVMITALLLVVALQLFLTWTRMGNAMRAVAQNADVASLMGIKVNKISSLAFALGAALAAAAAGLLAPLFVVNPFQGSFAVIRAFLIMVIAGMGSISGSIVGGLILGAVESLGYTLVGGIAEVFSFALVILLLIFRPQGLFGHI